MPADCAGAVALAGLGGGAGERTGGGASAGAGGVPVAGEGASAVPGTSGATGAGVGTGAEAGAGTSACIEFIDAAQALHLPAQLEQSEVGERCFHPTPEDATKQHHCQYDQPQSRHLSSCEG